MTPLTEIGEMLISDANKDYFFRPSLSAMTRIGSPVEIVSAYSVLGGAEVSRILANAIGAYGVPPGWLIKTLNKPAFGRKILSTAMHVMQACCDDDIDNLVGEWRPGKRGVVYRPGAMPPSEIIIIARELAEHGVIGKAKVRKLQKHESAQAYSNEFRAFEYISAARSHFGMPRAEAEQLTMTEFQLMLDAKYPNQKGFTRDEYDQVRDDYFTRKEARIAREVADRG